MYWSDVVDGKIRLKNDSQIKRLSKDSLVFGGGSEVKADAIIFAAAFPCLPSLLTTALMQVRRAKGALSACLSGGRPRSFPGVEDGPDSSPSS